MEVRDLEYFVACAETGNFTKAAQRVHIVQSAMSAAVARLERELGTVLLDRTSTPIAVTEPGQALLDAARRVLDAVEAARDDVDAAKGLVAGPVVLGATLTTGPLDLAASLGRLRRLHPAVVVQLRQSAAGAAGNLQALLDHTLDLALVTGPDPAPPGVTARPLVAEPLAFVCPPDHSLAGRRRLAAADIDPDGLLRFPPGWGIRAAIDQVWPPAGQPAEIADYGLMTRMVEAGLGTTLMPASALPHGSRVATVPVDDDRLVWTLWVATAAGRRTSRAVAAVMDALEEAARAVPGRGSLNPP